MSAPKGLSPEEVETILDSIADGVFTVDKDFRITWFNRAAEKITGVPPDEALGRYCCEVFRAEICESDCALRQAIDTGRPVVNRPVYILRPDGQRIPISVSCALLLDKKGEVMGGVETFRDLSLVEDLRKEVEQRYTFADIISRSHRMRDIFSILPEVAQSNATVLIEGESGTGKELLARAIHNLSARTDEPLVIVNCGALPDTLLESELFGHKAGAFTDAKKDRLGRIARAERGTLFLDEIGDISPALQIRLLRFLQERTYEPLGSSETIKADVRVVAATNKDLNQEMEENRFRRDLYYRVNVIRLALPPLRERKEDIPLLVQHFVAHMNRLRGKDITGLSQDAMSSFMDHDWPGNIRELENAIEHAFILCPGGFIERRHLPEQFRKSSSLPETLPMGSTLAEIEARVIYESLERNDWKRQATAKELGIDKTTLWRKIKQLGLEVSHGKTQRRKSSS
ncbi:MAG: sigma 54-interacting transcriptional regulator [Deltaproteobacteria bacterium]|nr:sigma 54-interacting transcriptional regulator [Deltaproteobacteria bacterium]